MLYCPKCRRLSEDSAKKCGNCRSAGLRPPGKEDMVFLCGCDQYLAGKVLEALEAAGIPSSSEETGSGGGYFTFDSMSMPTDRTVFALYDRLEEARELAAQVSAQVEAERAPQEEAEPPGGKRILWEVLSVVGFLLLVMGAVYGADALAGWLKGLMGLG